jgi:GNAT superfamily N-acetyltransferase
MFISISLPNLHKLNNFIGKIGKSSTSFRYFKSRKPEDAIKFHKHTLLFYKDSEVIGYGHLDLDSNDNKLWLGICVIDKYCGMGYGKIIMEKLISLQDEDIYLSVDRSNLPGVNLYKKFGFKTIDSNEKYFIMKRTYEA